MDWLKNGQCDKSGSGGVHWIYLHFDERNAGFVSSLFWVIVHRTYLKWNEHTLHFAKQTAEIVLINLGFFRSDSLDLNKILIKC